MDAYLTLSIRQLSVVCIFTKVHNNWKLRCENFKDSSRNALLLFKNWSYSRTVQEHFYKSLNFGEKII